MIEFVADDAQTQPRPRLRPAWTLWLWWVFATVVGEVAALVAFYLPIDWGTSRVQPGTLVFGVWLVGTSAVYGLTIGASQALVLRRAALTRRGIGSPWLWILASIVGCGLVGAVMLLWPTLMTARFGGVLVVSQTAFGK
jgi:hypothetical protein